MLAMDNPVEEIKRRLDIVDFIGSFITLKKVGRNFKANCPFHSEKTPSFIVSPERQIWHCFGSCGEGGDIIKFLMKWENITFFEALKELAQKTGVALKTVNFEDKTWQKKERFFSMNALAVEFFQYVLHKSKFGEKAKDYLKKREMNENIIKKFQLGYSPSSWDSLRLFLKRKKYSDEEIWENGLLVKTETGRFYDRFRGRLMFPLCDSRDHILGFSGRILDDKSKEAKYINTPETPIYHKRETLFGINVAKESIKKEKNVYLVEGEFDMITPYSNGFTNFVAIKGAAVTQEQLMLLKRLTEKITLTLDSDDAGVEAMKRGIEEAEKMDFDLTVVKFDFAKDPDEAVRKDKVAFKKAIEKPIPVYDFLIESSLKKYSPSDPFDKKKIADELIPFIERIANPIVKSHYVKKLSAILDVTESSLENLISRLRREKKKSQSYKPASKDTGNESREHVLEKYILSYIFQSEEPYVIGDKAFSVITPSDFIVPADQKIAEIFIEKKDSFGDEFNLNKFAAFLSPETKTIFDEIYLFASSDNVVPGESIEKLLYELKRFSLKRQIKDFLGHEETEKGRNDKLVSLTASLKEVEKKLISL